MRPERSVGQVVELLKHAIVFVDETLIGGVVQSSRAGNLKAFRRDQEIAPQTNGSCAASTALPSLAFHVKHREQGERLHLVSVSRGWVRLIDWRKEANEHDFRGVCLLSGKG